MGFVSNLGRHKLIFEFFSSSGGDSELGFAMKYKQISYFTLRKPYQDRSAVLREFGSYSRFGNKK